MGGQAILFTGANADIAGRPARIARTARVYTRATAAARRGAQMPPIIEVHFGKGVTHA